jgi:hypothetical protein
MLHLDPETSGNRLNKVIDLIAYKKPALRILEVNLDEEDSSCLWFDSGNAAYRQSYTTYNFGASNSNLLESVSAKYEGKENSAFLLIAPEEQAFGMPPPPEPYDLGLIKLSKTASTAEDILHSILPLLSADACTLVVRARNENGATPEQTGGAGESDGFEHIAVETSHTASAGSATGSSRSEDEKASSSIDSAAWYHDYLNYNNLAGPIELGDTTEDGRSAYLLPPTRSHQAKSISQRNLVVPRLSDGASPALTASLLSSLESAAWLVEERSWTN